MQMIGQTISSLPLISDNINYIKIENGIYDNLYVTHANEQVKEVDNFAVPNSWDEETYIYSKFNGDLSAGNADFGVKDTSNIVVKRRKKGTYKWFPLFVLNVDSSEDFNFVIIDPYVASKITYEYAVVPIINGEEGTYSISECKVSFDNLMVIDKDNTYSTYFDIETSQEKHNTSSSIMPIMAKYPIYVTNSSNDYFTGNVSATFLKVNPNKDEVYLDETIPYRDEVLNFLNNRKVKFIKDPYGKCWIAAIGDTISDESNGHHNSHKISFNFTEVGDVESNEDMNKFGFLDIGEEWWS